MKRIGILNREISSVVASMGHTDLLTICDGGFPVPPETKCIDLTLKGNMPRFFDVLDTVLEELIVEKIIVAQETAEVSPAVLEAMKQRFPEVELQLVPHTEFKRIAKGARATIRSGEFTSYSNIILQSGVVY
jgi:D-ribose pyranase